MGVLGDEVEAVPLHKPGSASVMCAAVWLLVGAACTLHTPPSPPLLRSALVQTAVLSREIWLNLLLNKLLATDSGVEGETYVNIYTQTLRWTPVLPCPHSQIPLFSQIAGPAWLQSLRGVPSQVQVSHGCSSSGAPVPLWHIMHSPEYVYSLSSWDLS